MLGYGRGLGMGYAIAALAVMGLAVGVVFRLKVLLPILATLLIVSVGVAITRSYGFIDALLTIFLVQVIVQAGYFSGVVIRAYFAGNRRMNHIF